MVIRNARWRVLAVALFAGALAVGPATPASASDPVNWVDPTYPGSVTDSASIAEVAFSNATATNAGVAPTQGCISAATTPYVRDDAESYTGFAVASRVWLYTNAYCSEHFTLQYFNTDDRQWYPIGSTSFSGGNNAYFVSEVRGGCIAGTWAYRVKGNSWHTEAVRITCTDRTDPFRIG